MGNQTSKAEQEALQKQITKLQERLHNMENNMKQLVTIVNNIPGKSLNVENLHVENSILLRNKDSSDYLYIAFDQDTNHLRIDKSFPLKEHPNCLIM